MSKKYWLKIGKEEDIRYLREDFQGLSFENAKFRPEICSIKDIKAGELMLVYIREKGKFYLSRIESVDEGIENKEDEWVHSINLEPLNNGRYYIGEIENWHELKKQVTFWEKYRNIGLALNCSMIEIGKEDFTKIVAFFDDKITID